MQHNEGPDAPVAFDDQNHRILLKWGIVRQKAEQISDKISPVDETIVILGIPFGLAQSVVLGIVNQAVREACCTGIDMENVPDSGPAVWVDDDGTLTSLRIDRNGVTVGVRNEKSCAHRSSRPAVKKDKEGLDSGSVTAG